MNGAGLEFSSEGFAPLITAYVKAQSQMGDVIKTANNPAFKTKYADLANVVEAVVPAFNAAGLAVIQSPSFDGEWVTTVTMIAHGEGGWLRSTIALRPNKSDPQGVGSAITYGRRYGLMAVAGVAPEDDDGNAACAGDQNRQGTSAPKISLAVTAAMTAITMCGSVADLKTWKADNGDMLASMPEADIAEIGAYFTKRFNALKSDAETIKRSATVAPANGANGHTGAAAPGSLLADDTIPF